MLVWMLRYYGKLYKYTNDRVDRCRRFVMYLCECRPYRGAEYLGKASLQERLGIRMRPWLKLDRDKEQRIVDKVLWKRKLKYWWYWKTWWYKD